LLGSFFERKKYCKQTLLAPKRMKHLAGRPSARQALAKEEVQKTVPSQDPGEKLYSASSA
jgi:hypothetical protein